MSLSKELVSVLDDLRRRSASVATGFPKLTHLMRTTDQVHVMLLQESRDHIRAKRE